MFGKRKRTNGKIVVSPSIKVYHGTNWKFDYAHPNADFGNVGDFGKGFYTTAYPEYAEKHILEKISNDLSIKGIVTYWIIEYEFDDELARKEGKIRILEENGEWARFVFQSRTGRYTGEEFEIIIGPSADGRIGDLIEEYSEQSYRDSMDWDRFCMLLESYRLSPQIVFLTQNAVDRYLRYVNVVEKHTSVRVR